jgi:hypothetical protein
MLNKMLQFSDERSGHWNNMNSVYSVKNLYSIRFNSRAIGVINADTPIYLICKSFINMRSKMLLGRIQCSLVKIELVSKETEILSAEGISSVEKSRCCLQVELFGIQAEMLSAKGIS